MGKINTTMETEKHLLFDIAEAEIDFSNDAWKDTVKNDFQEIQNSLEVKPDAQSPAYYTWFWFLIRYGRALSSPEGQAYMKRNNLNVFTLVKDVMGFTMASGGAYTIGYKFFDECLKNTTGVDVSGIKIHRSQTPRAESADNPLQQIYYGAPGTGKSHEINQKTEGENVIRTTFHPDSDYSTFVGAYKPTTKQVVLRDVSGHKIVENGEFVYEDRIVYEFVEQAFLQAYEQAWRNYAENSESPKKQYLVIEEINRGNCAQIFGDLFQLLDRNDSGFSDYPIKADKDMKKQLGKAFEGLSIANPDVINAQYKGRDVVTEVLSGDILLLPNNLYIWATMNTSDQSLFPIDSAFKRRWEWKYMPIAQGLDESGKELQWGIKVGSNIYDWWSFLDKINKQVYDLTHSEDKKLGFFFCKASDGIISVDTFVGKVVFYLWNDVFKDFDFDGAIFKDEDDSKLTYNKFYTNNLQGCSEVVIDKVDLFLNNLGVEILKSIETDREEESIPSGTKEKLLRFWQGFNNARNNHQDYSNTFNERAALPQTWMDLSMGSSKFWPTLNVVFSKSRIRCGIWIGTSEYKDEIFSKIKANEAAINDLMGCTMSYKENSKTYFIFAERNIDLNDESNWPEAYQWLMDKAVKLKKVKEQAGI